MYVKEKAGGQFIRGALASEISRGWAQVSAEEKQRLAAAAVAEAAEWAAVAGAEAAADDASTARAGRPFGF